MLSGAFYPDLKIGVSRRERMKKIAWGILGCARVIDAAFQSIRLGGPVRLQSGGAP